MSDPIFNCNELAVYSAAAAVIGFGLRECLSLITDWRQARNFRRAIKMQPARPWAVVQQDLTNNQTKQ